MRSCKQVGIAAGIVGTLRFYLPLLLASGLASPGHRLIAPAQQLHLTLLLRT